MESSYEAQLDRLRLKIVYDKVYSRNGIEFNILGVLR